MIRFIYFLHYLLARLIAGLLNLIPFGLAKCIARSMCRLFYYILSERRTIALHNLRMVFPEKSEAEIKTIALDSFANMGKIGIEFIRFPKLLRNKDFFKIDKPEVVQKALAYKKGVIVIVSHLTNWEAVAIVCGAAHTSYTIGRPLRNPYLYNYVKYLRGLTGTVSIDKAGAIREVMKQLKYNYLFGFLIDQHERQGAVKTNFFGKPCFTTTLPARIGAKWQIPVITCFADRDENDWLVVRSNGPYFLKNSGDEEADAVSNTQFLNDKIEEEIRKRPGDWLWMHRRWRAAYGNELSFMQQKHQDEALQAGTDERRVYG